MWPMPWMGVLRRKSLATKMSLCKGPILQHLHQVPVRSRRGILYMGSLYMGSLFEFSLGGEPLHGEPLLMGSST